MNRRFMAAVAGVAVAAAALTGCAAQDEAADGAAGAGGAGNRATDDFTPHVGPRQAVIVDTLTWRVRGARTRPSIGSEFARETANGVYVVVNVSVRNGKDESVTLRSDMATLTARGKSYETDTSGTIAAAGEGSEALILEDLGPDVTARGVLVFDVPPAVIGRRPEVCFGELGFGPGQGCIRLRIR